MFWLVFLKFLVVFVLGLIFGSFAGVLIERGEKGESLRGRSRCDHCKKKIVWYDNIPVFSFLLLRGRCHYCGQKISWWYPLMELIFGMVFVGLAWRSGFFAGWLSGDDVWRTVFCLAIGFVLLTILFWDWKYMIIPDGLVVGGLVIGVLFYLRAYLFSPDTLLAVNTDLSRNLLGGLAVGGFFYLLWRFSRGKWIGGGDVKLGFLSGFLVGWKLAYFLLLLSYLLGAVPALYLLLSGKAGTKSKIPFGPFLVVATLIILCWSDRLNHLLRYWF